MKNTKAAVSFFASVYRAEEGPSQKDPYFDQTSGMYTPVWLLSEAFAWTGNLAESDFVFDKDNVTAAYKGDITNTGSLLSAVLVVPGGGSVAGTSQINGLVIHNTGGVDIDIVLNPGEDSVTLASVAPGKRFSLMGDTPAGVALSAVQLIADSGTGSVEVLSTIIPLS